jgi:hypothetical protein
VPQADDRHDRRQRERAALGGRVLLIADPRAGLISAKGHLVDLSEGGCQVHIRSRVGAHVAARLRLDLGGTVMWLPVVTRWARPDATGWTLGCAFERLTPKTQAKLGRMLFELSLGRAARAAHTDEGGAS